jgi:voltage-gated potassium channel
LPADPAKTGRMDKSSQGAGHNLLERRIEKRGLRPRVAASVIAILWLGAIIAFGIVEHIVDPDSFGTIWDGMWWATQTVTTVGYGDVVPTETAGKFIASVLMIGGLSLFAVVTGTITSAFVTKAQAETKSVGEATIEAKLDQMTAELTAVREQLARLAPDEPPA